MSPSAGSENLAITRRGGLWGELGLALLPTITVLLVLAFVEDFTRQRLLFASLASSAFLIYLAPRHRTNGLRTLAIAQGSAALLGFGSRELFGTGYAAAAAAMVATIVLMVLLDAVHPPAVSTALGFAFRSGPETNLALFGIALTLVALLAFLQRASVWLVGRLGA